jgi:hypothetical protein
MFRNKDQVATLQVLYDESLRGIRDQQAAVEQLRNRVVALLSVASLAAALFGAHSLYRGSHPGWLLIFAGIALGAFGVSMLIAVYVLRPREDWQFYQDVRDYATEIQGGKPVSLAYALSNLTIHQEASFEVNEKILGDLHRWYRRACYLLAIQVIAWAIVAL